MTSTFIFTVVILSVLGIFLAAVLFFVAQKFKVYEDPRIDQVAAALPGANCGGCGFAGCRAFAESCVNAESLENLFCPVGGNAAMHTIAEILGKASVEMEPKISVLRCGGARDKRTEINTYDGVASCAVAAQLYDGNTACSYGCLMLGDCVRACSFGGLYLDPQTGLPVADESICTACGSCAKACPKMLLELRKRGPKGRRIHVNCANKDKGVVAKKACQVACIGCNKCVKACAFEAITLTNNLAYINDQKCTLCRKCVAECPTGAIVEANFPSKNSSNE